MKELNESGTGLFPVLRGKHASATCHRFYTPDISKELFWLLGRFPQRGTDIAYASEPVIASVAQVAGQQRRYSRLNPVARYTVIASGEPLRG